MVVFILHTLVRPGPCAHPVHAWELMGGEPMEPLSSGRFGAQAAGTHTSHTHAMAVITTGKCCEGSVRVHVCEGARDSVRVAQEGLLCGRKQLRWNRKITLGKRGRVDQGPGKGRECLEGTVGASWLNTEPEPGQAGASGHSLF